MYIAMFSGPKENIGHGNEIQEDNNLRLFLYILFFPHSLTNYCISSINAPLSHLQVP